MYEYDQSRPYYTPLLSTIFVPTTSNKNVILERQPAVPRLLFPALLPLPVVAAECCDLWKSEIDGTDSVIGSIHVESHHPSEHRVCLSGLRGSILDLFGAPRPVDVDEIARARVLGWLRRKVLSAGRGSRGSIGCHFGLN